MSLRMTSNALVAMAAAASEPLPTVVTVKPAALSTRATARAKPGSSSTTRTVLGAGSAEGVGIRTLANPRPLTAMSATPDIRCSAPSVKVPHYLQRARGDRPRVGNELAHGVNERAVNCRHSFDLGGALRKPVSDAADRLDVHPRMA